MNKSAISKRRKRKPVILQFRSDIPSNEQHPLANVEPSTRSMQRQTVIASVLARLAEGQSDEEQNVATIQLNEDVASKETSDQIEE